MIVYPNINPEAFAIGPLSIKWYGICYLLSFGLCYWHLVQKAKHFSYKIFNQTEIEDLIFYIAIGVIFGGRLGYILFYYPSEIISDPLSLLKFWLPGRSFHGGLLGVLIAILIYAKKHKKSFLSVTDFIAPTVPIGIMFGRVGNFINGELWGRITDVPWAMVFRHVDRFPRHPSQIYELLLEGVLLFGILKFFDNKCNNTLNNINTKISNSGFFLIFYALFRIVIENFREPDFDQGFVLLNLTMGQILSIPMLIVGLILCGCYSQLKVPPV